MITKAVSTRPAVNRASSRNRPSFSNATSVRSSSLSEENLAINPAELGAHSHHANATATSKPRIQ